MDRTPTRDAAVTDFGTWRSLVRDTFFAAELERPAGLAPAFSGRIRHRACGAVGLARIEASPHNFRRTAADVAREGREAADVYDVVLVLDGRGASRQDGRGGALSRGHLVISDTARPYQIDFDSPFHLVQLVLPRRLLGTEPEKLARVTGVPVDTSRGTAALLAAVLTEATDQDGHGRDGADGRGEVPYAADAHVADAVAALCRAVAAELLARRHDAGGESDAAAPAALAPASVPAQGTDAQRRDLRTRVMAWIESHLDDPTLDPAAIAGAHFISTRYLHLLFEDQPVSVSRHVRERRLDRIRHDLADPALLGTPVSALAARWGIGDAAQFSRLFRDRFGVSPSAYRADAHQRRSYEHA